MKRLLAIAAFLPLLLPGRVDAHGFEQYLANLDESETAAVADGREYSVGELKTLLAMRPPVAATGDFQFFGVRELLETAREAPAWGRFAEEARAAGVELPAEQEAAVELATRDFLESILFRELVLDTVSRPTVDRLLAEYEARRETDFAMPERFIVREVFVPEAPGAEERIRALHKRIVDGEAILDIQREVAGDEAAAARIVMPGTDDVPEVVLDALRELDDRALSAPVRSGAGWHVVQRQLHIPGGSMPFEAVFPVLLDEWLMRERDVAIATVFDPLVDDASLVKVYTQYLLNTGALALDEDLLMTVGERDFTRGELADAAGWRLNRETPLTESTFLRIAAQLGPVQDALLDTLIARSSKRDAPQVAFFRASKRETLLVETYLAKRFAETGGDSEDDGALHEFLRETISEEGRETAFEPLLMVGDTGY